MDETVIIFDDWEKVLKASVPPDSYRAYQEAIVKFRYWLRKTGKSPHAATFKQHLAWKKYYLAPDIFMIRQEALRWYYLEGRKRTLEGASSSGITEAGVDNHASRSSYTPDDETNPVQPPHTKKHSTGTTPKVGEYRVYSRNNLPGPAEPGSWTCRICCASP